MKKYYISAVAVLFAISGFAQGLPLRNVDNSKLISTEYHKKTSTNVSRDEVNDWVNYINLASDYYATTPRYSFNYLFPDSTVLAEFGTSFGGPWVHSIAQVFDLSSPVYSVGLNKRFVTTQNIFIDSIGVYGAYTRVNTSAADTLNVRIVRPTSVFYFTGQAADYGSDTLYFPGLGYDYTTNSPTNILAEFKVVLDDAFYADSIPGTGGLYFAGVASNYTLAGYTGANANVFGGLFGVEVDFMPGREWNATIETYDTAYTNDTTYMYDTTSMTDTIEVLFDTTGYTVDTLFMNDTLFYMADTIIVALDTVVHGDSVTTLYNTYDVTSIDTIYSIDTNITMNSITVSDTLETTFNSWTFVAAEPAGDNSVPNYLHREDYSTAYIAAQDLRYNNAGSWNGNYLPHWAYTQPAYSFDAFDIDVKVRQSNNASVKEIATTDASLLQNYPNPFNGETTIKYSLNNNANVSIEITDITGKKVAVINEGSKPAGNYNVTFNSSNVSSGIYYYSLIVNNQRITKKMTVSK